MRIYERGESHLLCGHWNGSPVEIGVTPVLKQIPPGNAYHYHPYHEYYVVLEGRAELLVEDQPVALEAGTVVMAEPGERHRLTWVDPVEGVRWVIIKERSAPGTKHCVSEERGG
jgi:mannose-6-phosphate isomerase-like protein (cupin superfamily)